jgi:hypothetical protein
MVFVSLHILKKSNNWSSFHTLLSKLETDRSLKLVRTTNIGLDLGCKSYWILNNFMNVFNKIKLEKCREIQASFGIVGKPYMSRDFMKKIL